MITTETKIEETINGAFLDGFDEGVYQTIDTMHELGLINENMAEMMKAAFYNDALSIRIDEEGQDKCIKEKLATILQLIATDCN